jgi:hypothetical protein
MMRLIHPKGLDLRRSELEEEEVCRDLRHTAEDGKDYNTRLYSL